MGSSLLHKYSNTNVCVCMTVCVKAGIHLTAPFWQQSLSAIALVAIHPCTNVSPKGKKRSKKKKVTFLLAFISRSEILKGQLMKFADV